MIIKSNEVIKFVNTCEHELKTEFDKINHVELVCLEKVLNAMNEIGLEERHLVGSTGYGHNDIGKDITNEIFAKLFNTESAYVSPLFTSGTSGISHTLLGLLRPNDTMLCISGTPYDTLSTVIHGNGQDNGSLKDFNINYDEIELIKGDFDYQKIENYLKHHKVKMIYIQRSRGYEWRNALTIDKIEKVISFVKNLTNAIVVVDNCYGEFVETREPTDVGADVMVSSMIKNIGGGVATTGAYVAGKKDLIERIACHLSSPALGFDTGSFQLGYRQFLQGLFLAPHVVSEAKKTVRLTSFIMQKYGYNTIPSLNDELSDIVCAIKFEDKDMLINFCTSIQSVSAVDSNAYIVPSEMPGYEDQIVMASGSFTQGSSIELSCDGPIREPYIAYLQGGLCYSHGKLALINALSKGIIKKKITNKS